MAKNYVFRAVGAVCLLISLLMFFVAPWASFNGIKKSDLKDFKEKSKETIEKMNKNLLSDYFLDEMEDLELDLKKSDIKNFISDTKYLLEDVTNMQAKPFTVTVYALKSRSIVKFLNEVAEENYLLRIAGITDDLMESLEVIELLIKASYIYTACVAIILIFGVCGIIFGCFGKKGFTITYFVLSTIYIVLFSAITILANIVIHEEYDISSKYSLSISYGGIVAFVTALIALIFICKGSKKKIKEAPQKELPPVTA